MRTAEEIQDFVSSYAGWLGVLSLARFGPFYQLAHGLLGLGVVNEDGAGALTLAGVVVALLVMLHDRRTYGRLRRRAQMDGKGALALLGAFLLIPVVLVLWTGAGYGLRDLAAVLGSVPVIAAALDLRRASGLWLIAAAAWFGMLYGVIWSAPWPMQAWLHIAVAIIVLVALVIEHQLMARRFEAVRA